ncbi:DUF2505 domain-containing protein [Skermania piniformis]|uniref:DUF2505 domain-containing protein n=1 Tax=Skermania pinensis TaxID=39122 RepID=A0ABX8SBI6_9ACTN|nr:DUF2505 domain-containing protein [Skermania piniformis]QXQ14359.1 DUF2505 domain-containing protein [Skermania piniformis]
MARRLDYSARYPLRTVGEVYRTLGDRNYWAARIEEMRKYSPNQLVEFRADESGIELVIEHVLPRTELPPIAQAIIRKDMVITRRETYGPLGPEVVGKYEASIPAGPGSLTGTMHLFPTDIGCTLRTSSEAKVYLPGGLRFERMMLVNLVDLFRAEAEFTASWLDTHHPVPR